MGKFDFSGGRTGGGFGKPVDTNIYTGHTATPLLPSLPSSTPKPNLLQSIFGGIKDYATNPKKLFSEIGLGLSTGLSKTGSVKQNSEIANILADNPLMSQIGKDQQASIQQQSDYLKANPVNTVPGMIGEQIPMIPLWAKGEGVVNLASKGLTKLAPSLNPLAAKIPSFVKGGLKDAATFGTVVAPVESIRDNDSFSQFLEREKQLPGVLLGGTALRGIGAGAKLGKDVIGEGGSLKQALALRKLNTPALEVNPLADVQSAFKSPLLRDVKAQQYSNIFSEASRPMNTVNSPRIGQTLPRQGLTDAELLAQKQLNAQSAFGGPRDIKKYSFTTGEQRAFQELQDGIAEAQNYVRHTDVLAPYPPGTTIEAAYADVKANTGVDLPKLMSNWEKAQSAKTSLSPKELDLGRKAGVIPPLKQREGFQVQQTSVEPPLLQRSIPERQPLQWTNKDGIQSAGQLPLQSITPENLGQLPGQRVQQTRPTQRVETPSIQSVEPPRVNGNLDMLAPPEPTGLGKVKEAVKSIPELPGKAYKSLFDNLSTLSHPNKVVKPKNILEDAHKMGLLTRNAMGTVEHINTVSLVDRAGNEIGEGFGKIVNDIPKGLEDDFNYYLLHSHNVQRSAQGKPIFAGKVSGDGSRKRAIELESSHPEFKELKKRVNSFIMQLSDAWGIESGLIEKELMNYSRGLYPEYVPTYRQLEASSSNGGFGKVGAAKVFKKAVGGDEKIIPPTESIPMLVNKLVMNARKNEAYQAVLNKVRSDPGGMKKYAELAKPDDELSATMSKSVENHGVDGALETTTLIEHPTKGRFLVVMENGKPTMLKVNDQAYWKSLQEVSQPRQSGGIESFGRTITQPFKNVVTAYNPIFAVNNIARDIPTAVINSIEKNPAYAGLNIKDAVAHIKKGSKEFKEFVALGGTRSNFFENTTGAGKFNPVSKLGRFNNTIETIPRFAEYLSTVKKGGGTYESKLEGIYNAAEVTTNFSRHGDLTKTIDSWVPYLNPAFQGLAKTARQVKNKPIQTALKGGAMITVPTVANYARNQVVNKEGYDQLDPRARDNYYNIARKDGTFTKIAKPRELGVVFGSGPERLLNYALGKPEPFRGFGKTVATNFSPMNPLESNYLSPVITNLPANKDFAGRTIVPMGMQDLSPRLQYDERTSEPAKYIGGKLNISPKQIDYLVKSYTGVVGQLGIPALTKNSSVADTLKRSFTNDPVYSNTIMDDFYTNRDKLNLLGRDAKASGEVELELQALDNGYKLNKGRFNSVADDLTDLRKESKAIQADSSLSKEEKEYKVRQLQLLMLQYARSANESYKPK